MQHNQVSERKPKFEKHPEHLLVYWKTLPFTAWLHIILFTSTLWDVKTFEVSF